MRAADATLSTDESAQEIRAKFNAFVEYSAYGYCELDPNGVVLAVNRRLSEILGFPADELVGHHFSEFLDVTDSRRSAEALHESEDRLQTIANTVLDAVVMMDPGGNVAYRNRAAEQMFGYRRDEIMGRSIHRVPARTTRQIARAGTG